MILPHHNSKRTPEQITDCSSMLKSDLSFEHWTHPNGMKFRWPLKFRVSTVTNERGGESTELVNKPAYHYLCWLTKVNKLPSVIWANRSSKLVVIWHLHDSYIIMTTILISSIGRKWYANFTRYHMGHPMVAPIWRTRIQLLTKLQELGRVVITKSF